MEKNENSISNVEKKEKVEFGSRFGMIIATIGFSVGVGNLWRFPYIVGSNGGGIFLLFYFLVVIVVGVPLLVAEFSIGAATSANPVRAYKMLAPNTKWHWNGLLHVSAAVLICAYTMPVYAWILYYVFNTATGSLSGLNAAEIETTFNSLVGNHQQVFFWAAINLGLTLLVVRNKLQNGVEKIAKILLPGLVIIMAIIIAKGMSLPNAIEGVRYFLTPDLSKFTFHSALAAVGQAFFSIGIAMAVGMLFASYMKEKDKDKLVESAIFVVSCDTLVAIAAGFMIFPSVFAFGLEPSSGPGLSFVTMPNVFNQMTGGVIWGVLFYLGFYFAAFTSNIAGWEVPISYFMQEHNFSRKKALAASTLIILAVEIPALWSMKIFTMIDYVESNFVLIIGAFLMTIFVGWVWGIDNFAEAARIKSKFVKTLFGVLLKYVNPIIILVLALSQFGVI
ncbi:MAG: sodium-dependent transporter [Sedimentibacter sp.]